MSMNMSMNMTALPRTARPALAGRVRPSACLLLAVLLLGLASGSAHAQWKNAQATNCSNPNVEQGQPWTVVNPLTSSTPVGTVLMERRFAMTTSFKAIVGQDPHDLVTGAHWVEGMGPPIPGGLAPTNIDGIGFKWEAASSDGVKRPLLKQMNPIAVEMLPVKVRDELAGATVSSYIQSLVLTQDPSTLGPGEIKVTNVAGSLQVRIHSVDVPGSTVSLGSTFTVPGVGQGCRQSITFDSIGIVSIGGGPPPPIPNTCDVVANQIIPVDLGHVPISQFQALGDTSPPKHFEIALSNCAVNAKPMISFRDKATPPNTDKTVLRLSAPGGQSLAQGFGIIMSREDGTRERIAYGDPATAKKYEMTIDKPGKSAKLPLSAQYLRTGSAAELKAGYAGGSAEFTFTFP